MKEFSIRTVVSHPVHWISCGFGLGLIPKAPGTAGTLLGIPIVYCLQPIGDIGFLAVVVFLFVVGVYSCQVTANALNQHDPGVIVWDEITGYCIALVFVPISAATLILAFVLFRFFDILKPWPISYFDKRLQGGFGIMFDDVIAGVFANLVLQAIVLIWLS